MEKAKELSGQNNTDNNTLAVRMAVNLWGHVPHFVAEETEVFPR